MTTTEWIYIALGVGAVYLLSQPKSGGAQAAAGAALGAYNPTDAQGQPNPADAAPLGANAPAGMFPDGGIARQDASQPGAGSYGGAAEQGSVNAPIGAIVSSSDPAAATGTMSPLTASRVSISDRGTTVIAPDDAAGRAALASLQKLPTAPAPPNPLAPASMTISKISTSGTGIVPPATQDRISVLSPEIRRFQPLRVVGR